MTINFNDCPNLFNLLTADFCDEELTMEDLFYLISEARKELGME